ncbi:pectinesterase inhibitor-like [Rhododendron vialii]|uniref:pectinesterase inhibitor-like n=1 Tax=Rhododendron vialii TaxID=182163 RepID=UPI00265DCA86|nr:pectinesterase inhibitor-like [Rhododendron vialii]
MAYALRLFFLLLVFWLSISTVRTIDLVDGVCAETSNPSFCKATLRSDSRSATANLTGFGDVAIELTVRNSIAALTKINRLKGQTKDVELKKRLDGNYIILQINQCDRVFLIPPSYPSPITFENKKTSLLGGIIRTIARILVV